MYICWTAGGARYFANDVGLSATSDSSVWYATGGTNPFNGVTTLFAVATIYEALEWVRNGTISGV